MIFEILMLICFGIAWPFSIWKSYHSGMNSGKSLPLMIAVFSGYVFGMIYKYFNNMDFVIYLYGLNALLVSIDIFLYFRNARSERPA